jgi:hypothetical protein
MVAWHATYVKRTWGTDPGGPDAEGEDGPLRCHGSEAAGTRPVSMNLNQLPFYLSPLGICTIGPEHCPPVCRNGAVILFFLPITTDAKQELQMIYIMLIK